MGAVASHDIAKVLGKANPFATLLNWVPKYVATRTLTGPLPWSPAAVLGPMLLRQHMNVFVNQDRTRDLTTALAPADEVTLMQALSGG